MDYSRTKVEKLLEKLSQYNHRKLTIVENNESHFGVVEPISQRQPLFLTSFNFVANNLDIKIPIGKDLNNNVVELDFDKIFVDNFF